MSSDDTEGSGWARPDGGDTPGGHTPGGSRRPRPSPQTPAPTGAPGQPPPPSAPGGPPPYYDPTAGWAGSTPGSYPDPTGGWDASSGGPPPPPWERDRQRRRKRLLTIVAVAAVLLLGIPVVLSVIAAIEADPVEGPPTAEEPTSPDEVEEVPPVDVDQLDGIDAVYGQLLNDIDASERAMLGFQEDLVAALREHLDGDVDRLLEEITAAAATRQRELVQIRGRMEDRLDDPGAERVREVYVDHLDSWVRYMAAVEQDPALISPQVDDSLYTLAINTTADDFARTLREELPDDIDEDVRALAEMILLRGFDSVGGPDA